ncbi:MAG: hypothetical protein ABI205_10820, partial [Gemmatimonadaceae bacterium]
MTAPFEPTKVRALVEQLARGDRSHALALHALISAANVNGIADFDGIAGAYRDDHLAVLRATGRDADREAGRLSLDEVRQHLATSVLPRLVADGVIVPPTNSSEPWATVSVVPRIWSDISSAREQVSTALRQTGEHPGMPGAGAGDGKSVASTHRPAPSGSVLEAKGLVKSYRRR